MPVASVGYHLLRAFVYSGTSLAALFAGALSQPLPLGWPEFLVLVAFWIASLQFFVAYAICFDYPDAAGTGTVSVMRRDAFWGSVLLAVLFAFSVFPWHWGVRGTTRHAIALVLYAAVFTCYGYWLYTRYCDVDRPPARHQIAWPSLLSIGVPFFVGTNILWTHDSVGYLSWITSLLLFSVLLEGLFTRFRDSRWPKRILVLASLGACTIIAAGVLLHRLGLIYLGESVVRQASAILFGISIAAYLASFEAWRVTSYVAIKERLNPQSRHDDIDISLGGEYQLATSISLILALVGTPLLYIVGNFGVLFIVGFLIHGSIAFIYWISRDEDDLLSPTWPRLKTFFGFGLLFVLVADAAWPISQPRPLLGPASVVEIVIGYALGISAFLALVRPIATQRRLMRRAPVKPGQFILRLFIVRIHLVYLFGLLASAGLFLTVLMREPLSSINPALAAKIEHALFCYLVYIFVCAGVWVLDKSGGLPRGWSRLTALTSAIFLLVRVPSCLLVGVVAAWPLRHSASLATDFCLVAVPFMLAAAAGFALNDWADVTQDRVNKPWRPVAGGVVSPRCALTVAILFSILACIVAIAGENSWELGWQAAALAGVWVYPYVVRRAGLLKGVLATLISLTPICASVGFATGIGEAAVLLCGGFVFLVGREILMDVRDLPGDRIASLDTVPMRLGVSHALLLAGGLQTAALVLVLSSALALWSVVLTAIGALSLALAVYGICRRSPMLQEAGVLGMWIPMILTVARLS